MQYCKFIVTFVHKLLDMLIANKTILDEFVQHHANAAAPLNNWLVKVKSATWTSNTELKQMFPTADYVRNGRYVFNIGGNRFRLVAVVLFVNGVMNIRFVGSHAEYDRIDCATI